LSEVFEYECKNIFLDHKRKFLFAAALQEPRWPRASKTFCTPLTKPTVLTMQYLPYGAKHIRC